MATCSVLNSSGTSFSVTNEILDSDGNAFLVGNTVLNSAGVGFTVCVSDITFLNTGGGADASDEEKTQVQKEDIFLLNFVKAYLKNFI